MKFRVMLEIGWKILSGATRQRRNKQILGAVLGISLGLVPLVVVLNVADGMITGITDRYLETLTYHFQLQSYDPWTPQSLDDLKDRLSPLEDVTQIIPEIQGFGLAYSPTRRMGVTLRGLPDEVLMEDLGFLKYLTFDQGGPSFKTTEGALIGREVARRLGLSIGDDLKILTSRNFAGRSFVPRITSFVIEGIFTTGYQELDKLWVLLPYKRGVQLMVGNEYQSFVGLKVKDPQDGLEGSQDRLRKVLPENIRLSNWKGRSRAQYQNFQTTRTLLLFIMFMIFVVSSFNISSAIYMMVIDKQKEIAFLKSVGAKPGQITQIFTTMGLWIGGLGTILGIGLGVLISAQLNTLISIFDGLMNFWNSLWSGGSTTTPAPESLLNNAYYLVEIPFSLDGGSLFIIALISILVAILAAWIPASRAGKLRPLEVLRKH